MPALDFKIIEDAITIIGERTGLTETNEWHTLLEQSAGTDPAAATVFRPYAVAAILLGNALNVEQIHEAEGVKFSNPKATVLALIQTQAAWDGALSLTVPGQWTTAKLKSMLLGGGGSPGPVFQKLGYSD